jgi:hypothetical protein
MLANCGCGLVPGCAAICRVTYSYLRVALGDITIQIEPCVTDAKERED